MAEQPVKSVLVDLHSATPRNTSNENLVMTICQLLVCVKWYVVLSMRRVGHCSPGPNDVILSKSIRQSQPLNLFLNHAQPDHQIELWQHATLIPTLILTTCRRI